MMCPPPTLLPRLTMFFLAASIGCSGGSSEASTPVGSPDIVIQPGVKFQVITGWETHAQSGQEFASFPSYKNQLFDQAVNDLGITRIRLEVRSSMEHTRDLWSEYRSGRIDEAAYRCLRFSTVNDNTDPSVLAVEGFKFSFVDDFVDQVVLPLKQRVEARGEHLFLNLNYVAFIKQMTGAGCPADLQYTHTTPAEYAEFILATVQHLKARYNLVPDAIEFLLEPEHNTVWSGEKIGQGIVAASERLTAAGFDIKFIAPSTTNMGNAVNYFDAIRSVSGATSRMLELSYHRYGGVSDANLEAIASRARAAGIGTSMLEHIGSGYEDLHRDLKVGMASAWQQFALAYTGEDNGGKYFVISGSEAPATVTMGNRTRYLRQYFRWVRPGAQRIGAQSRNDDLDPLAFIGRDGRYVTVIKASKAASFTVEGLPGGTYKVTYTTETATGSAYPDIVLIDGEPLSTSIPARGVLTIAGRSP